MFVPPAAESAAATAQPGYDARSEHFTKEEMAELFKPKKKKLVSPQTLHEQTRLHVLK